MRRNREEEAPRVWAPIPAASCPADDFVTGKRPPVRAQPEPWFRLYSLDIAREPRFMDSACDSVCR